MTMLIIFLLLLVPFASALETDAALSIIAPDTLFTQKEYTKLFKISNKHPSVGNLENITVFYSISRGEKSIFRDSFTKATIKRSTSVDTGRLFFTEAGEYTLCGTLLLHDNNRENNRVCKSLRVLPLKTFDVSLEQLSNGTIFVLVNASELLSFTLKKGKTMLFNSTSSASSFVLPFAPEKDGLYTFIVVGEQDKKEYSVFLHAPLKISSLTGNIPRQTINNRPYTTDSRPQTPDFQPTTIDHKPLILNHKSLSPRDKFPTTTNKSQALDQRYFFLSFLFFLPLFFGAVYILIKK